MKIAFGAQSRFLITFYELYLTLKKLDNRITGAIFFASDSAFYYKNQMCQQIENDPTVIIIKEWEYTSKEVRSQRHESHYDIIRSYTNFNLRDAIICDRRLIYGAYTKIIQSYESQYSEAELENIIVHSLCAIESYLADETIIVVTPTPSCFGDYLLYFFAMKNNQKYLQLKFTKIKNYICFSRSFKGNTPIEIKNRFEKIVSKAEVSKNADAASDFISSHKHQQLKYEGVISSRKKPKTAYFQNLINSIISQLLITAKTIKNKKRRIILADRHVPPTFKNTFINFIQKPFREFILPIMLKRKFVSLSSINSEGTFFYPMHSEPEIALNVNGRQWQNQIELIRRIAQSIPLGSKLVIKEHPRNVGYRKISYYKKLSNISNVVFIRDDVPTNHIIDSCRAVFTVSGVVGFESILRDKPAVVFGNVNYSCLKGSCLMTLNSTDELHEKLMHFLRNYEFDKKFLIDYVSAVMDTALPINFYSELLKKKDRVSYGDINSEGDPFEALAAHFLQVAES